MLTLVRPAPAGQPLATPARRKGAHSPGLSLTADETRHARAALRNTVRAYGSASCLADAMGLPVTTVTRAGCRSFSGTFAIRLARAAGVSVEAMLSGALNAAGRCPTCGHLAGGAR